MTWYKPFSLLFALFAMLFLTWFIDGFSEYSVFLPGMVTIGSLIIPLSLIFLFYDLYQKEKSEIALRLTLRQFLIGMCVSVFFTCLLTYMFDGLSIYRRFYGVPNPFYYLYESPIISTALSALIEEVAKALIIWLLIRKYLKRYRKDESLRRKAFTIALLAGCAVGAGFAVFETVGATLHAGEWHSVMSNLCVKGTLTSSSHVAWGILMGVSFYAAASKKHNFIVAIAAIIGVFTLHFLWNLAGDLNIAHFNIYQIFVVNWVIIVFILMASKTAKAIINER